jgi:hypothetical protein
MVDFGIGFLANGRNDDGEALRAPHPAAETESARCRRLGLAS